MKHKKLAWAGGIAGVALVGVIAASAAAGSGNGVKVAPAAKPVAAPSMQPMTAQPMPSTPAHATPSHVPVHHAPAKASATVPVMTVTEQQAVDGAQGYLSDGQGFSYEGLLQQLTSSSGDGDTVADAKFAISYLHPDWDAQAVASAKGYLSDGQGFSKSGLYQQLTSSDGEGFTPAQADYALSKVGM